MHIFSFPSIFFHAPDVINCGFYQAENFRCSRKPELKNVFWKNIFSDSGRSEKFKSGLRSAHAYRFQHDRFFLLKRAVLAFFWHQNHARGKPSRSRVCNKTEEKEEKNEETFSRIRVVRKIPAESGVICHSNRRKKKFLT